MEDILKQFKMTPYKVIHLTVESAVGYREEKPRIPTEVELKAERWGKETTMEYYNADVAKWLSSGEKIEFASLSELEKLTHEVCASKQWNVSWFKDNVRLNGLDITNLVEVRETGNLLLCSPPNIEYRLYFRAPVVSTQEENQTTLAGEIISLVKNHVGSGSALISIITKYKISRL